MVETALIQTSQLSKLNRDQLRFLERAMKREGKRLGNQEMVSFARSAFLNPIVLLVLGFVMIDYLEKADWPGREGDTMLGGVSANALRGAVATGVVLDALGKSGIAEALGQVAKAGGSAVSSALPLLAGATAIPGVPPPP